jgi:hypothetical protein
MNKPKERPILFSASMVRAILEGRKSQTRRVAKRIPWIGAVNPNFSQARAFSNAGEFRIAGSEEMTTGFRCPYGQPGDRLWLRERHAFETKGACALGGTHYESPWFWADADEYGLLGHDGQGPIYTEELRWRPSIHMPRSASRILLEVTDVRVERLQAISEDDAIAEGVPSHATAVERQESYGPMKGPWFERPQAGAYACLWESINGPGSWDANPWVWAITFRRIEA